jgi:hypothetical protein
MNQTIVVDVIQPLYHSINRMTCGDTGVSMWAVIAHGDNDFTQMIDSYDSLALAQMEYPRAWCSFNETESILFTS